MNQAAPEGKHACPKADGSAPQWLLQAATLHVQMRKHALANQQPADRIVELPTKEAPPPGSAP